MKFPTATMQAPDAGSGVETETEKKRVAKHELLDEQGNVVDNEEEATGIRYTRDGVDQPFDWQSGLPVGTEACMMALLGAKTLATNEASAVHNNPKGRGTPQECMDAVLERFALVKSGKWVDRTREGVGAKIDKDVLAEAIVQQLLEEGKFTQEQVDQGKKADVRQKLEDDPTYMRKARSVPAVATRYAQLAGRTTATVDDLMV